MVLSSLIDMVIEKLKSELIKQVQLVWQGGDDLQTLSRTLQEIYCVLADAEEAQITKRTVKFWLNELRDIAYDADDVLDEVQYEAFREEAERGQTTEGKWKRALDFCSSIFSSRANPISIRLARRIKIINERLDGVSKNINNFALRKDDGIGRVIQLDTGLLPTSSVPTQRELEFFGRGEDKEKILKQLLSDDTRGGQKTYSVISIIGMGGLGKTTLAQHVYNDERIKEHFEVRAWACVSENFDVLKITKDIIESARGNCSPSSHDRLQCELVEILKAKRFLIVLDDVWNEKFEPWNGLQGPFNFGARGSKILVTTRHQTVSVAMFADHPYPMKCLANDDCVKLLLQHAFAGQRRDAYPELMEIGKKLAERHCQGLPLAAKVLGSLLYGKEDPNFWESILNSQIWISGDHGNQVDEVMKALRVSYHHLPPHIKQCFAYCSIFPQAYVFDKDELVRLWMAQGFILPTRSVTRGMLLEETGSQYFDLLLQRSFFHAEFRGEFTSYKMHDCIYDLAVLVSSDECLRVGYDTTPTLDDRYRHVSILEAHSDERGENLGSFMQCKHLRTIRRVGKGPYAREQPAEMTCQKAVNSLIANFKCLRVLILEYSKLDELPGEISNLKHLRCLHISNTYIKQLPESVGSLYHLQTLNLGGCAKLCSLPSEVRKLKNLRYLNLSNSYMEQLPKSVCSLSNLQTLCLYNCPNLCSLPEEIGELKNLRNLNLSYAKIQQLPESVSELHNLENLNLFNCNNLCSFPRETWKLINLRSLQFGFCYKLTNMPLGIGKLSSLQTLPKFIVGRESGNKIGELKGLNRLRGVRGFLLIEDIQNVSNAEEAKEAHVKDKAYLKGLTLQWKPQEEAPLQNKLAEILEALQPHQNLKSLCIRGYEGNIYPTWLQGMDLPNLEDFTLENCKNCTSLPQLGHFPRLKRVSIKSMNGVKRIGRDFFGDGEIKGSFPLLEDLKIKSMPNLEEFEEGGNGFSCVRLDIQACPKLTRVPNYFSTVKYVCLSNCGELTCCPTWPSLRGLKLFACNEILLRDWAPRLTSLSFLQFGDFNDLTSLPKGMLHRLSNLTHLKIRECEKLESLVDNEDEGLPSTLVSLEISHCYSLKSLGGKCLLAALQHLKIYNCSKLKIEDRDKISHIPDYNINNQILSSEALQI